ncbi:hypothetical protein J1N35_015847 [Gossypium stocksii]|uniref:Uncharacterized protein n=1 Tax=Gossypium stocksii TaxID=47602 RepID=A0A9D3VZ58_9ROSI|nr:hypothetical protein J1N35_015847 [Gossypium stocksii]
MQNGNIFSLLFTTKIVTHEWVGPTHFFKKQLSPKEALAVCFQAFRQQLDNVMNINNSSPSTRAPPSEVACVPTPPPPATSTPIGASKNMVAKTKGGEETKNAKV